MGSLPCESVFVTFYFRDRGCRDRGKPEGKGRNDKASAREALFAASLPVFGGVADGTRTHDDQNHNLGLYQLSYSHRR